MTNLPSPLLEGRELVVLSDDRHLECHEFASSSQHVACVGRASALVQAFVEPGRLLRGQLRSRGRDVATSLSDPSVGYVPRKLGAPAEFSVHAALLHAARMAGRGSAEVDQALERLSLSRLRGEKLSRLSPLQERLVGLAQGTLDEPSLLVVEDPYVDLGDEEAAVVEDYLEQALRGRSSIVSIEANSPWSRALLARSQEALFAAGPSLLGPLPPAELPLEGLWLRADAERSPALVNALREEQADVTETPRAGVLLVRGLPGLRILELARRTGAVVHELSPVR